MDYKAVNPGEREEDNRLTERLKEHPEIREQVRVMLEEVEQMKKSRAKLDDVEESLVERLREVGSTALEEHARE